MAKENRGQTVCNMPMTRLGAVATRQVPALSASPPVQHAALVPVAGLLFLSGVWRANLSSVLVP